MASLLACSPSLSGGLLSALLAQCCGLVHLGVCEDEEETIEAIQALHPDLLLLDGGDFAGRAANRCHRILHHLSTIQNPIRIILLCPDRQVAPPPALATAAWAVLSDDAYWPQLLARITDLRLAAAADRDSRVPPLPDPRCFGRLNPRERTVLAHLAEGLMNKEIARVLGLTRRTVETYRKAISAKLGVSGAQLLRVAVLHHCMVLTRPLLAPASQRIRNCKRSAVPAATPVPHLPQPDAPAQRVVPLMRATLGPTSVV